MTYIGIDPGITGAVALFQESRNMVAFFDTPIYQDGKRNRIDVAEAVRVMKRIKDAWIKEGCLVAIEKSQPMPKNGSIGCFGLGYSFGVWLGILAALGLPYHLVTPQAWKKLLMPGEPKEKDASRIVAQRMFPCTASDSNLVLKKHHGRADALLIAEWGRRVPGGEGAA